MKRYDLVERFTAGTGAYITRDLTLERAEELRAERIQGHVDWDVQHSPHAVDDAELERLHELAASHFEIVEASDFRS